MEPNTSSISPKILVVDDDINLLELITQVLSLYGLSCETAENGLKALEMVKRKFYPLVVSDIRMPIMTGTELLKSIRKYQTDLPEKSKVILMTAYSTNEIVDNADELGVDDFLTKPFDITYFVGRVNEMLGKTGNP